MEWRQSLWVRAVLFLLLVLGTGAIELLVRSNEIETCLADEFTRAACIEQHGGPGRIIWTALTVAVLASPLFLTNRVRDALAPYVGRLSIVPEEDEDRRTLGRLGRLAVASSVALCFTLVLVLALEGVDGAWYHVFRVGVFLSGFSLLVSLIAFVGVTRRVKRTGNYSRSG